MPTSEEQIAKAREIAEEIAKLPGVESAHVDDWGRYGNFQVAIALKPLSGEEHCHYYANSGRRLYRFDPEVNLRSLTPRIYHVLRKHSALREGTIEHPRPHYGRYGYGRYQQKEYIGHDGLWSMVHFRIL